MKFRQMRSVCTMMAMLAWTGCSGSKATFGTGAKGSADAGPEISQDAASASGGAEGDSGVSVPDGGGPPPRGLVAPKPEPPERAAAQALAVQALAAAPAQAAA
jgi:hypothetical protein